MNRCVREGCLHDEADHGYGCLLRDCLCTRFLPTLDDVGKLMAERDQAVLALREMAAWHGATHDEDCPADDTCRCERKPFNDRVNAACSLDVERGLSAPPAIVVSLVYGRQSARRL